MLRHLPIAVVVVLAAVEASSSPAQDVRQQGKTLVFAPATAEQNWSRATTLTTAGLVSGFAYAKRHGASVESYGRELGDLFAPGWGVQDGGRALQFARSIQNNFRAWHGTTIDVLAADDTSLTMRVSRSWRPYFGPTQSSLGVSLAEYDSVGMLFHEQIARYLGLHFAQRTDSNYLYITVGGRSKLGVLEFPRGTFAVAFDPQYLKDNPDLAGDYEVTFAPNGRMTLKKGGTVEVEEDYSIWLDQITQSSSTKCSTPGSYRWFVHPATKIVSFQRLVDDCPGRARFVSAQRLTKK